jgi:hypothetical protein
MNFRIRRLISLCLIAAALLIFGSGYAGTSLTANDLLPLPLHASAVNLQIDIQRDLIGTLFGEYNGYLRFEMPTAEAEAFLKSQGIYEVTSVSTDPLMVLDNAVSGQTPMRQIVLQVRPAWWQPEQGRAFLIGYHARERDQSAGSDSSWYIADVSDPDTAIIYVFAFEV